MFIEVKRFTLTSGNGPEFAQRFANSNLVITHSGFINLKSGVSQKLNTDEVCVIVTWEDEAAFRAWKQSPAHKESHRSRPKNENLLKVVSETFEIVERSITLP